VPKLHEIARSTASVPHHSIAVSETLYFHHYSEIQDGDGKNFID